MITKTIKKTLPLLFFILTFTNISKAQQLANTYWAGYNLTNTLDLYWHFDLNTLYFSFDNITYLPVSSYTENGNVFQIIDLASSQCLTDTGTYTFLIQNDTLVFTPVFDACVSRLDYFMTHYLVSVTTGIGAVNSFPSFEIFPNPFRDNLNINSSDNELSEIILYDIASKKIIQKQFTGSVILNTEQLEKGLYLYEVVGRNGLMKKGKLLKD